MAGSVSPGQTLTPNLNVFAPATYYGDTWGANGGGQGAIGGGVVGQTGFTKPIAVTLCNGETAANYRPLTPSTVLGAENNTALSGQTLDSALVKGGTNAG